MTNFYERLVVEKENGRLPEAIYNTLSQFYDDYDTALSKQQKRPDETLLNTFLDEVISQLASPYIFHPYHVAIRHPYDYYQFGLDFLQPLILFDQSRVLGEEHFQTVCDQLEKGDNVIFLANHQIEPDPQVLSLLLRERFPKLAEQMIFVAGDRVITDPLSIPFSMGCNLLCIYSKRHIENPPEKKEQKLLHNRKTMHRMGELLAEGGKCIYVAPSGGRDRPNASGSVPVSQFEPQSIEMFRLMAKKAEKGTHFYPLALATYALLPPPNQVEKNIGERRAAASAPVHIALGKEIDMETLISSDVQDRKEQRQQRSDNIHSLVVKEYERIYKAY